MTRLNSVVLPAPFGPITLTISPSVDVQVEVVDDFEAAESHRDALQIEKLVVHLDDLHALLAEQPGRAAAPSAQ